MWPGFRWLITNFHAAMKRRLRLSEQLHIGNVFCSRHRYGKEEMRYESCDDHASSSNETTRRVASAAQSSDFSTSPGAKRAASQWPKKWATSFARPGDDPTC